MYFAAASLRPQVGRLVARSTTTTAPAARRNTSWCAFEQPDPRDYPPPSWVRQDQASKRSPETKEKANNNDDDGSSTAQAPEHAPAKAQPESDNKTKTENKATTTAPVPERHHNPDKWRAEMWDNSAMDVRSPLFTRPADALEPASLSQVTSAPGGGPAIVGGGFDRVRRTLMQLAAQRDAAAQAQAQAQGNNDASHVYSSRTPTLRLNMPDSPATFGCAHKSFSQQRRHYGTKARQDQGQSPTSDSNNNTTSSPTPPAPINTNTRISIAGSPATFGIALDDDAANGSVQARVRARTSAATERRARRDALEEAARFHPVHVEELAQLEEAMVAERDFEEAEKFHRAQDELVQAEEEERKGKEAQK